MFKDINLDENKEKYQLLINGLTEDYEYVCMVDYKKGTLTPISASKDIISLIQVNSSEITNYTEQTDAILRKIIPFEDLMDFRKKTAPEVVLKELKKKPVYRVKFRANIIGKLQYYCVKFSRCKNHSNTILLGFVCVEDYIEEGIRQERLIAEKFRRDNEKDHELLDAALSSSDSIYKINLVKNTIHIIKQSSFSISRFGNVVDKKIPYAQTFLSYMDSFVAPEDKEQLRAGFSVETIRRELSANLSITRTFRCLVGQNYRYFEMKARRLGTGEINEIMVGVSDVNEEMLHKIASTNLFDENNTAYVIDLVAGTYTLFKQKETQEYEDLLTYDFNKDMKKIVPFVNPDDLGIFKQVATCAAIKRFLGKAETREVTYRVNGFEFAWTRCNAKVIDRINGAPSIVLLSLTGLDEKTGELLDYQARKAENEEMFRRCADVFYRYEDMDSAMNTLLNDLTVYYGGERAYIFEFNKDLTKLNNTYEYCKEGIEPEIDKLQDLDIELVEDWIEQFHAKGEFYLTSRSSRYKADSETSRILEMQGIESLMTAPFIENGEVVGFLGVDNPTKRTDDLFVLRTITSMAKSELNKRVRIQMVEAEKEAVIAGLAGDYEGVIYVSYDHKDPKKDSVDIYRLNPKFKEKIPGWEYEKNYHNRLELMKDYVVHPEDKESFYQRTRRLAIANGVLENLAYKVDFRTLIDGEINSYQLKYVADMSIEGELKGYVVGLHNRDDEVAKEQEIRKTLEDARIRAEDASRAKTEFLSRMSHDIRTPINGVIGMTEIAKKHIDDSSKIKDCLSKIDTSSHHLLSLVNDVLDMSRIESGKTEIISSPMNMISFADNCCSIITGQMSDRSLHFVRDYNEFEHAGILGDELHLRQIVINILGNAVKFTPDGGTITFSIRELEVIGEMVTYELKISDTGMGMKKEYMDHIWEAFTQEDAGMRTHYKGTGLGMAITKQLVDMMGGKISVKSEINVGSVFTIIMRFPILKEKQIVQKEGEERGIEGARILLVEDNDLNMEIAKELLEDEGAIVECAENGQIALDIFAASKPNAFDLILMDIMMPVMDGLTAAKRIRALQRSDAGLIPIIAMTANAFEEDARKSKDAGMNAHVAKPIQVPVLLKTLGNFLDK